MKRKNGIIGLLSISIILFLIAGCGGATGKVIAEQEDISVRLPIPIYEAAATPFFVALEQGYYAEEGLNVTFNLGSPELNPVKMVATGVDDFGVLGGPDTLLVARSKGQPLTAVAILHRNSDFSVLLTLKESGLTTLADLEGKKVGFFYGHISTDVLRNLFHKEGVTVQEVDVGFDYNPLLTGKVDAEWAFRTTAGVFLPAKGVEVNTISPADYGIRTHGYTLFCNEELIAENPELVERFVRATLKGVAFTTEHPEEALEALYQQDPKLNRELEAKRLQLYNKVTSNSEAYPPGYMDEEMFTETYERLVAEGVITNKFDVNDAFTTRFIGGVYT